MNCGLKIIIVALGAAVLGGGVTSALADEAGVEVDLGDLRGEILSLFAPAGAVATETNLNYKGAAASAPAAPPSLAALLGAGWLVLKSEDPLRSWAHGRVPLLLPVRLLRSCALPS